MARSFSDAGLLAWAWGADETDGRVLRSEWEHAIHYLELTAGCRPAPLADETGARSAAGH